MKREIKPDTTEKTTKETARETAATAVLELNKTDEVKLASLRAKHKTAHDKWDAAWNEMKALQAQIDPLQQAIEERSLVAKRVSAVSIDPPRQAKESTSCVA